ncbi:MAG: hypothetical protein EXS25_11400 [Pedosphaera sp.]|nr:hypothetical protein [Pedosphaera sp.]
MGELAMLAQDATKSSDDRAAYQAEFAKLGTFMTDTAAKNFNGTSLFSATALTVTTDETGTLTSMAGLDLKVTAVAVNDESLSTAASVATALIDLKAATTAVAKFRAEIGVNQATLSYTSNQLTVSSENLAAASS